MHTIENPPIPFSYPFNGGMQVGSELIFQGATYHGERKRFHINLNGEGDNVVLHFNPRFKFLEDTIVLNSRTYAGWGTEERHRNRLRVGDQFRIRIVCHHSHFVIFINDKELARYEHRLAPQMVRSLEMDGDLAVQRIQMINFPQSQAPQPYVPPPPQPFPSAPPMGAGLSAPEPHYPYLKPDFVPPPSAWAPQQNQFQNPGQNDYTPGFRNPSPNHSHYCPHCNSRGCYQCRHG